MTKQEFISTRKAIGRYGFRLTLVWLIGVALFALWSGKKDLHGTNPLFAICFIVYFVGGISLNIWLQIRYQKKIGFICPNCGRRFLKSQADAVFATGNLVIEIKTRITDDGDAIGKWVFDIKENLLALNTAFAKIAHELNGDDKIRIRSAIAGLTQFSRMEHEDIYEQQQELWEALNKFPSV